MLCQRYYEISKDIHFDGYGTSTVGVSVPFQVQKRVRPTLTKSGVTWPILNCTQPVVKYYSAYGFSLQVTVSVVGGVYFTSGDFNSGYYYSADAEL
jgi:hypothetical protein